MLPGSLLPQAWDAHFLGASQDPRFTGDWRIFLYMDIKMWQQLINSPLPQRLGLPCIRMDMTLPLLNFAEKKTGPLGK